MQEAKHTQGPAVFTDTSIRNNLIGCHWTIADFSPVSQTIASESSLNSYGGELAAIEAALGQLLYSVNCGAFGPKVTVFSDSQGALRALSNPSRQSGQFLIRRICQQARLINASNQTVLFQWCPGH